MSKWGTYNTTAANNNSTPPNGWPEGQAPSTVNDCAREMMAQTAAAIANLEYLDLGHVPTFVNGTSFTIASPDTVNFTVGRRIKAGDGANTIYGTIASVSSTLVICQLDASASQLVFDSSLTTVALAVIRPDNSSLPENLWKRKNVIINGNMEVWQRSATFAIPNTGATTYTADRWSMACSLSANAASNITRWERSANASAVPTVLQTGMLLDSSLIVSVSTIATTVAAGQFARLRYVVEGYDFRQLAQRPMNLSFWVNTRQSGTYCLALKNSGSDRSFVQNYTISAIGVWTRFSLPIVKSPAAGTWDYSTGPGLEISFVLAAGSGFQGGGGNWTAANIIATSSQVNFFQSAGNTFAITGVQLEEGQFATPLEVRAYQHELTLCTRYLQVFNSNNNSRVVGFCVGTARALGDQQLLTTMRSGPTITFEGAPTLWSCFTAAGVANSGSAITTNTISINNITYDLNTQNATLVAGNATEILVSSANTLIDAEL